MKKLEEDSIIFFIELTIKSSELGSMLDDVKDKLNQIADATVSCFKFS